MTSRWTRRGWAAVLCASLSLTTGGSGTADDPFTIVLFPDTQNYHEGDPNFAADVVTSCITTTAMSTTYECQTQWVAENRASRNIRGVIHLGDITNTNGVSTDNARRAWERVSDAHKILDRVDLPYAVVPGNHDHPRSSNNGEHVLHRDTKWFHWFFPPSRYQWPWYVDSFPKTFRANRNNAITFSSGRTKYLVVSLDFAPEKDAVCWADSLARAMRDHILIVATHCYQGKGALRADSTRELVHQPCAISYHIVGMDGEDLWNELLALHSNIRLVVSGHVQAGASYGTTPSRAGGHPVHQLLVDYQDEQLSGREHGAGWMRLLRIDPGASTLTSEPLSVLGRSSFNARSTSDVCDTDAERVRCYASDPAHKDHAFSVNFDVSSSIPDRHEEPQSFTDRFVNEESAGNHSQSRVAMTPTGDFVSVWRDDSEEPSGYYEIFARSFRRDGCGRSSGYRVNQNSHRQQREPDIAVDAAGRVVVVWADDSRGAADTYQIYARGLLADGRQRFFPITVNQVSIGDQRTPRVASMPDGRFIVTWRDTRDDDGDIFARGFNADGTPLFAEVRVNATGRAGQQDSPDVAAAADGRFAVTWRSGTDVRLQSFDAAGTPVGLPQTVNAGGTASRPALSAASDGNAVVAWRQGSNRVMLKRFVIGSTLPAAATEVTNAGGGSVDLPAVGIAQTGEVVVSWQDDSGDDGWWQIHKREFGADGAARGGASTVNKNSRGQQKEPSIDVASETDRDGHRVRWVVSWTDDLDRNGATQILTRGGSFHVRAP